jgi:hypothetical protein
MSMAAWSLRHELTVRAARYAAGFTATRIGVQR